MEVWHLTFSSDGRFPLFQDEASRRAAVRKLVKVAGREMLLFSIVDDHAHQVIGCEPGRKGKICGGLLTSLRSVSNVDIRPAYQRPVKNRSHMTWLVKYLLEQVVHHDMNEHPALWSGSCYQDIVGARFIEGLHLRVGALLPRLGTEKINEVVGIPAHPLSPANDTAIRRVGVTRLVDAAGNALAVGPTLSGRRAPVVLAKRAVAHIAEGAGVSRKEVAWALGLCPETVRLLLQVPVDSKVLEAVRLRLALEDLVGGKG